MCNNKYNFLKTAVETSKAGRDKYYSWPTLPTSFSGFFEAVYLFKKFLFIIHCERY